ncbi:MAG: hypothetical protein LBF08_03190, partial [Dysgonamonadaceae bacterium]|nr:hypothetical protein [Dysgonamonadaceae bacterium]
LSNYDSGIAFEKLTKDYLMNFVFFLCDELDMRNTSIENQLLYLRRFRICLLIRHSNPKIANAFQRKILTLFRRTIVNYPVNIYRSENKHIKCVSLFVKQSKKVKYS